MQQNLVHLWLLHVQARQMPHNAENDYLCAGYIISDIVEHVGILLLQVYLVYISNIHFQEYHK